MKIKLEDINSSAKEHNWKVITKEYKNLNTEMTFECEEGHRVIAPYSKIRNKWECPVCRRNKLKNQEKKIVAKKKDTYRVLALDQATYVSGFAIFDNKKLIRSGIFETDLQEEIERDNRIKHWLISMIDNWEPDIVALEDIQLQQYNGRNGNVVTYKVLAHLQGILMECLHEEGIKYVIVSSATWRHHCGVKGRTKADKKKSMQILVKDWFDISVTNDESDAIGIGKYVADKYTKKEIYFNFE